MNIPMWSSNLLFWSAQVALLVIAASLLAQVLRLRQPSVLLVFWRSLIALSLLLPLLQPWYRPAVVPAIFVSGDVPVATLPASPTPRVQRWQLPSTELLAEVSGVVILVGIAVRFTLLALGLLKLRQLRRTSSPIVSSSEPAAVLEAMHSLVNARAEFRLSATVESPVTFGFVSPMILLPERFSTLEPRFQSAIACHELVHVRRCDWAHHLGEEFLRATFWFHPAIAWLISRVRLVREQIVDLEVVRLTQARRPYVDALLEFTNARPSIAAIPAPPFLAERQLVERVSLMLKEVRMSRTRLIASLTVILCSLALVLALAARTFPLKAAPLPTQSMLADGAAPLLQQIEVKHHDFDAKTLTDAMVNQEQVRMNQPPGRLTVETQYDQAKANNMKKLLEDFWNDRGITVEVRDTLTVSSRSPGYATLEFDVYKQTLLPGRLEGGIHGGVSGGVDAGVPSGGPSGRGPSGGPSSGVTSGVGGGVSGGVSGARTIRSTSQSVPDVDVSTIWTDVVKRGPMVRQVRGLGTLVPAQDSAGLVARITVPVYLTVDIRPSQSATIDTRMGLVKGHVIGINVGSFGDTRSVYIALDGALPERAAVDLSIDATIDIETLQNVLYIGRPVHGDSNSTISLFKISADGKEAERVAVKFGKASVNAIEVLDGLKEGDKIILSDMSPYDNADRIRLTDTNHVVKR